MRLACESSANELKKMTKKCYTIIYCKNRSELE